MLWVGPHIQGVDLCLLVWLGDWSLQKHLQHIKVNFLGGPSVSVLCDPFFFQNKREKAKYLQSNYRICFCRRRKPPFQDRKNMENTKKKKENNRK